MLDFIQIGNTVKKGILEIYPKFLVKRSKDLMIRGGDFYAIWDEKVGLWSTDEYHAQNLIDAEVDKWVKEHADVLNQPYNIQYISNAESKVVDRWHKYCRDQLSDNYHPLDEKIIFSDAETKREDYA